MIFHLDYDVFLRLFIVLNGMFLAMAIYLKGKDMLSRVRSGFRKLQGSTFLLLSLLLLVLTFVLSQTHAYYSADDSIYVSITEQSKSNENLYLIDPSTGNSEYAFSRAYRLQGWELFQSVLSDVSGLSTTEFVQGVVPIVMLTVVFSLFLLIFRHMLKAEEPYLALIFVQLLFLYGAFSTRAQPTFFMTRQWQGKAILSLFIIPLLSFVLYKMYQLPKKASVLPFIFAIIMVNIAALSLNPTSTFLCSSLVGVFALITFYKRRSFKELLLILATIVPFVPLTVYRLLGSRVNSGSGRLDIKSYNDYVLEFVGHPGFLILLVIGLIVFYKKKSISKDRVFHYIFPALLLLTVLNPLTQPLVSTYVTSTTYWRLFWLLPMFITLPVLGVELYKILKEKLQKSPLIGKGYASALGVAFVVVIIAISGKPIHGGDLASLEYNTTKDKSPVGVSSTIGYIENLPDGRVLAASGPAIYLHNYTSKHEIVAPRELIVRVHYEKGSYEYITRMQLATIMDKRGDDFFSTERYHFELDRIGVDYVVYELDNVFVNEYINDYDTIPLYENEVFGIFKVVR